MIKTEVRKHLGRLDKQQVSLFNNIKPLFQAKALVIVLTKIDLQSYKELEPEMKDQIKRVATTFAESDKVGQLWFFQTDVGD